AYQSLIEKPELLHADYGYELFAQAHQEFIHLFDTLAAGQRVVLSEEVQRFLNELTAFVQQDIEAVAATTTPEAQVVAEPVATVEDKAAVANTTAVDFAQLSQRIQLDHQQMQAADANNDFDEDLLGIFIEEAEELLVGIDQDLSTLTRDQTNTSALN